MTDHRLDHRNDTGHDPLLAPTADERDRQGTADGHGGAAQTDHGQALSHDPDRRGAGQDHGDSRHGNGQYDVGNGQYTGGQYGDGQYGESQYSDGPQADGRHAREQRYTDGTGPFIAEGRAEQLALRLQHTVSGFVDAPRKSVEEADALLQEAASVFTDSIAERRRNLRAGWNGNAEDGGAAAADTEELRTVLRDYRDLMDRLLKT
ncbi:hypothetical protein GCM10009716_28170 [Streptomyces sodiiphilus]|uniref:Uncharacterized protein n=1 Tax=Streptomyces sodiiphilus TaxID=226217 RepID=A0ABN2PBE2_9ACTN